MGIFVYLASRVVYTNIAAENLFGQIFAFSLVVIPSIAIYLAFAYLLKLKELKLITDILRHKLKN